MTALRPERESGHRDPGSDDGTPYEQQSYGVSGAIPAPGGPGPFEAPVDGLGPMPPYETAAQHAYADPGAPYGGMSPVHEAPQRPQYEGSRQPGPAATPAYATAPRTPSAQAGAPYAEQPVAPAATPTAAVPAYAPELPPIDEETVALRLPQAPPEASDASGGAWDDTGAPAAPGGRAARRKAAKRQGHGHGHGRQPGGPEPAAVAEAGAAPPSRMEARRAARARKPGMGVIASRAIGEVFITTGVLMLLFVTYQLWWTNYRAHQQAGSEASHLQEDWAEGKRAPGAFEPGQGFAIMDIPKLDVVVPIAEGINKQKVLDRGMVGHYGEDSIPTAMPDARTGNFAVAGHRNTHGEPFRYINRLKPGDPIVVETQDMYYVYKMTSILPVTSPKNTSVLEPIPNGSGFTAPGRYITLTTCTPEFTSKYRMIVWGKMVEERPRSKGKPDVLIR